MPEWFPLYQAAQILGCTPMELEDAPTVWIERAFIIPEAEALIRKYRPLLGKKK